MVLSTRERIILMAAVVVVGALVADKLVLTPVMDTLERTETHKQQLLAELNEAQNLFQRQRLMERKWKALLSDGLGSAAEAESRIARALDGWSGQAGLALSSVKPDRVASTKGLQEMTFTVAGRGSLYAVAQFLWHVETASLPIKVKDMQLGSTSEAGDSMSLQLRLSALYLGAKAKPSEERPVRQEQPEVDDEALL